MYKLLLIITICMLTGCASTTQKPKAEVKEVHKETIVQAPTHTPSEQLGLNNTDWSRYSEYGLFSLYLILLLTACIYFKKTGKRLSEVEAPLRAMAPKLSPVTKILSYLAKVLGKIYCKKK